MVGLCVCVYNVCRGHIASAMHPVEKGKNVHFNCFMRRIINLDKSLYEKHLSCAGMDSRKRNLSAEEALEIFFSLPDNASELGQRLGELTVCKGCIRQ